MFASDAGLKIHHYHHHNHHHHYQHHHHIHPHNRSPPTLNIKYLYATCFPLSDICSPNIVVRYTFFLTCCAVFANHFDFSHAAV
jgi:hypothetical protein